MVVPKQLGTGDRMYGQPTDLETNGNEALYLLLCIGPLTTPKNMADIREKFHSFWGLIKEIALNLKFFNHFFGFSIPKMASHQNEHLESRGWQRGFYPLFVTTIENWAINVNRISAKPMSSNASFVSISGKSDLTEVYRNDRTNENNHPFLPRGSTRRHVIKYYFHATSLSSPMTLSPSSYVHV